MAGTIIQVNTSPGGLPKRAVGAAFISSLGIEGDLHAHPQVHGGPRRAILIIASEVIDDLAERGFPVFYGALGENLTTRGFDLSDVRVGDRIRAGGAMLEITQPRRPCAQLNIYGSIHSEIYDAQVKALDPTAPHWGMSGLLTSVISPGPVGPGDPIEVLATLA